MSNRLNLEQRVYFRDALRNARAEAQRDAEGFEHIVHALEWIAGFVTQENLGLGAAFRAIHEIAKASPLADDVPTELREFHTPFEALFGQLRNGRNDAFHEGAIARHLAGDAVIVALILEDALMSSAQTIGDFMIRRPQCAELWQPISFLRQIMLVNSFSHLPVQTETGWQLVSDLAVAKFLRVAPTKPERLKRLRMPLDQARQHGLELLKGPICPADMSIVNALAISNGLPMLVVSADNRHCSDSRVRSICCELAMLT